MALVVHRCLRHFHSMLAGGGPEAQEEANPQAGGGSAVGAPAAGHAIGLGTIDENPAGATFCAVRYMCPLELPRIVLCL